MTAFDGCQSRDDRAGVEPARIDSPRVHQKGKHPKGCFSFCNHKGESKGAVVNDVPVARQSRLTRRRQPTVSSQKSYSILPCKVVAFLRKL